MAEEIQENMSMDEILSSIKNILSDGATTTENTPVSDTVSPEVVPTMNIEVPDTSSVDLELDDTDDGVLDLTEDMRVVTPVINNIPEPITPVEEPVVEIDISDELSTVSIPLSDSVEVEAKSEPEPDPVLSPAIPSVEADVSSDPIYSPEEDDLSQSLYTEPESLVNETPEVPSVGSDFNVETMSEPDPYAEENFAEPNYIEPSEPEMDASDVSANIINNFAKLFSGKQETSMSEAPKANLSSKLGPDATLHDMIKVSIHDMINENLIQNVVSEIDIKSMVEAEASSQVKLWLNNNLPALVESIVKKEIERVMVKAGKN